MLDKKLRRANGLLTTIEQYMKTERTHVETQCILELMFLAGEPILLANYSPEDLVGQIAVEFDDLRDYIHRARARLRLCLLPESWENEFLELIIVPLNGFVFLEPARDDADRFLAEVISFMKTASHVAI